MPPKLEDVPTKAHKQVVPGNVTKEIPRAADEIHADLIVLGVHPATFRWALRKDESAYFVVASAACPALSFRTPGQRVKKAPDSIHDVYVQG